MESIFDFGVRLSFVGIIVVFFSLALISAIIAFIRRIDEGWADREKLQSDEALLKEATIDDLTLVLIAAAVATIFQGRTRIHSIKRVTPGSARGSVWTMQGRAILHGSHRIDKG